MTKILIDEAVVKQMIQKLKGIKRGHRYCEDTWYSCPKHPEGCANDAVGDECDCGADEANAAIDAIVTDLNQALANEALDKMADNARELGLSYEQPAQQESVFAIRLLTDQCAALIQERDELQKQVWRYEKNGVTCQTYRHTVEQSCSECNVQMNYTTPPAPARPWVGLTDEEIYEAGHLKVEGERMLPFSFARAIEAKLKEKNT